MQRKNAIGILRRHFDLPLFGVTAAIITIGLVNLYSASHMWGAGKFQSQLGAFGVGATAFVLFTLIDYRALLRVAYPLYWIALASLLLVWLPKPIGITINKAHRWFGYAYIQSLRIQPSELMKIALILALAKNLHEEPATEGRGILSLLMPIGLAIAPMILVAAQPDRSTSMIIFLIFLSIMIVVRLKLRSVLVLAGVTLAIAPITWLSLSETKRDRIIQLFSDSPDVQGAGWQAEQSVTAIGSGQIFGKGFMQSSQARMKFLPEYLTDFPFAVYGEEWGFVGCLLVLALYCFLILWALNLASQARDRFGAVICVGVASLFFWHVVINVGMVTRVLPVMGVTLPLISFGGNSVLATMVAIGLLMNVSIRRFGY